MDTQMNIDNNPQNLQPLAQNTIAQPIVSSAKTNLNVTQVSLIVLICLVIFGIGGVFIGKQLFSQGNRVAEVLPSSVPTDNPDSSPLPTSAPATPSTKLMLSKVISSSCINNKVQIEKLPFSLSSSFKSVYKLQTTLDCFSADENYVYSTITTKTPDFSGDDRNIYFFHQNSKYMGMGDVFQPINNYKTVMIDGKEFWINIREPGPYGISTLGVWIDVINEKQNADTGTIVRVSDLEIVKDQQVLDLVRNNGTLESEPDGKEIYTVDPSKKLQFVSDCMKLIPQLSQMKKSAKDVSSDLDGVIF